MMNPWSDVLYKGRRRKEKGKKLRNKGRRRGRMGEYRHGKGRGKDTSRKGSGKG